MRDLGRSLRALPNRTLIPSSNTFFHFASVISYYMTVVPRRMIRDSLIRYILGTGGSVSLPFHECAEY